MADLEFSLGLDASQFNSQLGDIQSALNDVASKANAAAGGVGNVGTASGEAAGKVGAAKTELTGLAGALEAASRAGSGVTTSLELVGVEAGAGAQHVRLMNEALKELAAASGPLIILMAAVEGVTKAFDFVKDSINIAADMQSQMATLGAAVESQGGNWEKMRDGVEKFLETAELATGFTSSEMVPAFNNLVTAGNDVHDSEIIMGVAAELARAKHISLQEATQLLIDAEAGRAQGLAKLDTNVKATIQSHGKFSDVLKTLHKDMSGAITDNNSLEMQQARSKVVLEQLSETIGKVFIPWLTDMATTIIGTVTEFEKFGKGASEAFHVVVDALGNMVHAFADAGDGLAKFFGGDFAGAAASFKNAWHDATTMTAADLNTLHDAMSNMGAIFQNSFDAGHGIVNQAIYDFNKKLGGGLDGGLDHDRTMGKGKGGKHGKHSSATGYTPQLQDTSGDFADIAAAAQKEAAALDPLVALKDKLADKEQALSHAMKMTTTESGYHTAALELQNAKIADAKQYMDAVAAALVKDQDAQSKDKQAVIDTAVAHDQAKQNLNAFNESLRGKTHLSEADKETQKALEKAVTDTNTAHQKAVTALGQATAAVSKHTTELHNATTAYHALKDAADETIPDMQRKWDAFMSREHDRMAEDLATFGKTNAQKVVIYQQMLDNLNTADVDYEKKREELQRKLDDAILAAEQDTYNKQKAMREQEQKAVGNFINQVIVQHKSMRDVLKSIDDQILQDFINMVSKMIIESQLFKQIAGFLGFGGGGSSWTPNWGNITTANLVGGGGTTSWTPNWSGLPSTPGLIGSSSNSLGIPGGAAAGAAYNNMQMPTVNIGQIGSTPISPSSAAADSAKSSTEQIASKQAAILSAVSGAIMGFQDGQSKYGGNPWAEGLGAAAGAAGGYFFGPIGAWVGSTVGSFIGSLFGNHWTHADQPDIYDDTYKNLLPSWNGSPGQYNGTWYNPASQFSIAAGNQPLWQQLETFIGDSNNLKGLSADQLAAVNQLKSLGSDLHVTSEKQGVLTFADGQKISVANWEDLVKKLETIPGAPGSGTSAPPNPNVPVFNLLRGANPDVINGMKQVGTINMNTGVFTSASSPTNSSSSTSSQPVEVHVHVGGHVFGDGGMAVLAQKMREAFFSNRAGNFMNSRFGVFGTPAANPYPG